MVREFKLPDVGEGVAEGEIVRWLVEPGDAVSEDQPVAEVETDKALVEIPSPVDGTVTELRAEEGELVPVGDVFIVFEEAGGADAGEQTRAEPPADGAPEEEPAEEAATEETDGTPTAGEPAGAAPAEEADEESTVGTERGGRVFAPPHVRRVARELGVDLAAVEGTGGGGRVTESDVRAAAGGAETTAPETPAAEESAPEARTAEAGEPATEAAARDRTLAAPATRRLAEELGVDLDAVPAVEQREGEAFVTPEAVREFAERRPAAGAAEAGAPPEAREERVPYRGVRRTIGEQMERSAYTAVHVTHHDIADATELVTTRAALKEAAAERGIRLTYLPLVIKAVVAALGDHPALNATLDEENGEIVRKRYYNVGVATATDAGLLVPVVDDADRKGLLQLASEVNELTEKARNRAIAREEMQGGTFTITNFGSIGGEYATPIINYPETAILGLGRLEERPQVVDGAVVARHTLPLSLSIDHRVVDGAEAAAFTNAVKGYLENPARLLLK